MEKMNISGHQSQQSGLYSEGEHDDPHGLSNNKI